MHRRARALAVSLTAIALFVVACDDEPEPGTSKYPVYDWTPTQEIQPPASSDCKRVLLVGDSLAVQVAPYLQRYFEFYDYCAEVVDDVIKGSAPADVDGDGRSADGTWSERLSRDITEHEPDLIVSFFNGNGGGALQAANREQTLAMLSTASAALIPMYWVLPPLGAFLCQWDAPDNALGYRAYRQWVLETIPPLVPGTVNGNALTPVATPTSGAEGYNDRLRIDRKEEVVRSFDCLHLESKGAQVLAYEVIFATQGAWGAPPGPPT